MSGLSYRVVKVTRGVLCATRRVTVMLERQKETSVETRASPGDLRPTRRARDKEEELVRSPRGQAAKGRTPSRLGGRWPEFRYGYERKLC